MSEAGKRFNEQRVRPAIDKTGFGSSKRGAFYISLGKAGFASVQSKVPFV